MAEEQKAEMTDEQILAVLNGEEGGAQPEQVADVPSQSSATEGAGGAESPAAEPPASEPEPTADLPEPSGVLAGQEAQQPPAAAQDPLDIYQAKLAELQRSMQAAADEADYERLAQVQSEITQYQAAIAAETARRAAQEAVYQQQLVQAAKKIEAENPLFLKGSPQYDPQAVQEVTAIFKGFQSQNPDADPEELLRRATKYVLAARGQQQQPQQQQQPPQQQVNPALLNQPPQPSGGAPTPTTIDPNNLTFDQWQQLTPEQRRAILHSVE